MQRGFFRIGFILHLESRIPKLVKVKAHRQQVIAKTAAFLLLCIDDGAEEIDKILGRPAGL